MDSLRIAEATRIRFGTEIIYMSPNVV